MMQVTHGDWGPGTEPSFIRITMFEGDPSPMIEMWSIDPSQANTPDVPVYSYFRYQRQYFETDDDYFGALRKSKIYLFSREEIERG